MSQDLTIVNTAEITSQPLERNPAAVYLASLRPTGKRSMERALRAIIEAVTGQPGNVLEFNWHALRYQHTQAIRAALMEKYKPATVNQMLSALRGVLAQAENLELISPEDYRRAIKVKNVKNETLPRGRALSRGELSAIINTCGNDTSVAGARDAAMFAVLYAAGLRRAELVKLDLADYEPESGALTVRSGKGGKDRLTYLESGAGAALSDWLALRGREAGPLFTALTKGTRITGRRITAQTVFDILARRAIESGVSSFSPHDLRRTFISDLLDAGADISTVQKLAGHSQVSTTARYDRRGEETKKKAASLLHVPYQPRRLAI